MARFIKKTILFLAINAALFLVLTTIVVFLNKSFTEDCPSTNGIENIILGDSHIMWSLDDRQLKNTRNFALNAEGYIYTFEKLRYLLNRKNDIKRVYLGFSYHNLSSYYNDYLFGALSLHFFYRYIGILGIDDYKALVWENPKNIILMPPIIFRRGLWNILSRKCTFLGKFPKKKMQQTFQIEKAKERIKAQYYSEGTIDSFSKINVDYLKKIINLCRRNGIEIIALNTPLQAEYQKQIPEKFVSEYGRLLKAYNLEVFEFSGLQLPNSYFLPDGDHVNYNGAMAVTSFFKKRLEIGHYKDDRAMSDMH